MLRIPKVISKTFSDTSSILIRGLIFMHDRSHLIYKLTNDNVMTTKQSGIILGTILGTRTQMQGIWTKKV